ncbi:cardiac-enriched FHL2-interacting protein [Hyla sarda]|uniref:cardiac-enriched FHL2-interacting protein n=1 Tax=Hyla sarda TaxID=327740 RepID=UPI0024C2572A|nr:cardiac-enriched FHL2-interacting protein [Hyla sarda]
MLRYKKHKRQTDGLGTSVTQMDDTDREVSSFTDRAFRSLCVAEEEPFNDVPHLPSPIRGMPLSTKYHLGIFNLSVRKTQPLAQLPTTPRQRGKWAPTFQPLLNSTKVGLTDIKTNNKLCAPVPRGYKQRSKVSSLIQTFDNIENEIPDDFLSHTRLLFSKGSQRDMVESPLSETVERIDIRNEPVLESINPDDSHLNESHNLQRRTARDVFLESQSEMCSRLSMSPSRSPGSPLADPVKKVGKQRDSLRRTAFLHSEHSAFKSWSDINKRMVGGEESDNSIPGTPTIPRSATPCSPLLQRTMAGIRAKDGGIELGWASPASSLSSSYDANQMLRTVPPLPTRKNTRQNRDSCHKTQRTPLNSRSHDGLKTDEGHLSTKEQDNWMNKVNASKSPEQQSHEPLPNHEEVISNVPHSFTKVNEENRAKAANTQQIEMSEATSKEEVKEPERDKPPPGRIKTLIKQIEKETVKDMVPSHFTENKPNIRDSPKDETVNVPTPLEKSPPISNTTLGSKDPVPPWRKAKSSHKIEPEKKSTAAESFETIPAGKEEIPEEKPSSFNISNLLTPVIRRKNIHEALDENIVMAPTSTAKEQDQKEINLYQKRDDYKSKATSLLFNIKDMRKRVKSTYNPAITTRNGCENNLISDVKMQENVSHDIHLPDVNKSIYDTKNSKQTHFEENLRTTRESEIKSDLVGNESENYLSLSPMDQITPLQNGEISKEKEQSGAHFMHEENTASVGLIANDNNISKEIDYPSLNLYSKVDTCVDSEQIEYTQDSVPCLKSTEVHPLPIEESVREEIKNDEGINGVSNSSLGVLENVSRQSEQCLPVPEMESEWDIERDESEKKVVQDDDTQDILQYFAVNSSNGVDGIESDGKSNILECQTEKGQEKLTDEQPRPESMCAEEEFRRPSSITSFKPNLFCFKDNKMKSTPVTKSVRLPLFRSLSEDCLAFRKLEDNISWRIGDLRDTRESKGISTDILSTNNFEIGNVSKNQKHVIVSPTSKTPKQEAIEYNQIKTQKEEAGDQALSDAINVNKGNRSKKYPCFEESFFHPVETCVSEVAGPSPECNTLIVHNVGEPMNEQVNGEHDSPYVDAENTNYSPIDNELLHFEDSINFPEDIACSTITSPMSESVTCSIVTSPISVNTQSSGFTTALSALEDIPSPPLTSVNTRNGKFNFLRPERVNTTDSDAKNIDLTTPEKTSISESQRMHAKPPAVPPKTEKALRRAKRLTKKRRKTDIPRVQDGNLQESDTVLDVPSPGNVTPTLVTPQSHDKLMSCRSRTLEHEDIISECSTPSLPLTQRKLLQDPDSGQYFVVDIPVCLRIKTFYDPETGKYLQMSLPTSERESPAFDMSNSSCMTYPGLTPVPVSSLAPFKGASRLLNHDHVNTCDSKSLWNEDSLKMNNFIHCDSHDQRMTETPLSMDRITSRSSDIISMKDIDDFAVEAVS